MRGVSGAREPATKVPWRVSRANTPLLLAGVGCVLVAVTGAGLTVGGVSAKGLTSVGALVVVVFGGLLVAASLVVGVEPPETSDGRRHLRAPRGWFLGAAPRRTSRFVSRRELERLVDTLVRADGRAVALVGMGGAGKTVLAAEAAHHKRVRRRFRAGVAWLAVEPRADVRLLQSDLAQRLGAGEAVFREASEGRGALAGLLAGRRVLVVLDNVWERDVLDAFPPDCQMLFTTRSLGLARDVNAVTVEVAELELEQALELLSNWTVRERGALDRAPAAELCRRLDLLALGVAMAGAMIGPSGDEQRWKDVLARLEAADLGRIQADFGEEYPHPTLLAAIELGIDELPDELARQRYRELAVFNGRGPFPRSAAEALWASAGVSGPEAGDLLTLLERRSLIHPEGGDRYTLHDLQADVVAHQLGPQGLTVAHEQLLGGYRPSEPGGWPSAPDDGYLLENLAYHLARAGRGDELRDLLTEFAWLYTKLQTVGLVSLLADYAQLPEDSAAQTLRAALRLSAHTLADDPDQLAGQLIGRLADDHDPELSRLLEQAAAWSQRPWLCPLTGALGSPQGPLRLTLRHSDWVRAVAVTPDGAQIVSGGDDGTVRVWELDSGREAVRWTGDSEVTACAPGLDAPLTLAVGEARGTTYALRLQGLSRD